MKTGQKGRWIANALAAVCATFVAAGVAQAADQTAPRFQVTGTVLRVDGPTAEFCLTLSAPIDVADKAQILSSLEVRKDGAKLKLSPRDLSLSPTDICVQQLEYRSRYDLFMRKIANAAGEKLAAPYDAVFAVPDRKASLSFVTVSDLPVLPRHVRAQAGKNANASMAHVLRSVNVEQTHLTLYRVSDVDSLPGAWQQFTQINLSPSESLTFARTKGQKVFESDLVFGANPNAEQTLLAPLPSDAELSPGLYYLAAAPRQNEDGKTALFAGQWFLVSDLRLSALRLPDGIKVFTGNLAERKPAAGVEMQLLSRDGDRLGETKTNAEGEAFMAANSGKSAALLIARTAAGDVDILDLTRDDSLSLGAPAPKAFVRADREAYQPGSAASVALRAEDAQGRPLALTGSVLKLLRPDRRLYSQQTVGATKDGVTLVNMPLPIAGKAGVWFLSWQREDGGVLAETSLRIASDATPARVDLSLPRDPAEGDAAARLSVKVTDPQGHPLAFKSGTLTARAVRPENPAWKAYRFGVAVRSSDTPLVEAAFVTGADGTAKVMLPLPADTAETPDRLDVTARLAQGAESGPVPLVLRRSGALIGLRAHTDGQTFAENGVATFDAIAIDAAGKRRAESDLSYLIYEEGRSFEWFPSEGHWDYKPQPQRRRVGGGPLSIAASGETLISWPVTTGQYALEVLSAQGDVLARYRFEAGRVAMAPTQKESVRIGFVQPPEALEDRQETKIKVNLDAPAYVTGLVFDGKARQAFARFLPAGVSEIGLSPTEEWGAQATLRLQASFADSPAPVSIERLFTIRHPRRELGLDIAAPRLATAGAGLSIPVKVQKIQGRLPTFVSVVATTLADDGSTLRPALRQDRLPVDAEGKAIAKLNLPVYNGALRVTIRGWNENQFGEKSLTLPAQEALAIDGASPEMMGTGDRVDLSLKLANNAAPEGAYTYEIDAPDILTVKGATKGRLTLKKGKPQTLALSLTGRIAGDGTVRLDLSGPSGSRFVREWPVVVRGDARVVWDSAQRPLEPNKDLLFPAAKPEGTHDPVGILSPAELPPLYPLLHGLASSRPYTTAEIGLWLEALRLWDEPLKALGMAHGARLETLKNAYLYELQLRQNEDGGFAAVEAGQDSDLVSTAAAVVALADAAVRPTSLGVEWLAGKMQNTWFDEAEREPRVFALQALAHLHKADLSALRYFSETSRGKDLSPAASAALGLALAEAGDEEAASPWFARARDALRDGGASDWATARFLSAHEKEVAPDLQAKLAAMKPSAPEDTASASQKALRLIAWGQTLARFGTWSAMIDGQETKTVGFAVLRMPHDKERPDGLHLSSGRKLVLQELTARQQPAGKAAPKNGDESAIQRGFLKMNGEGLAFDTSLMLSDTYLMVVEGTAKAGETLRLFVPQDAVLAYTLPPDSEAMRSLFPFLGDHLAPVRDRAVLPSGLGLTLKADGPWRAAFIVHPVRRGALTLPLARVFDDKGNESVYPQNALPFSVW